MFAGLRILLARQRFGFEHISGNFEEELEDFQDVGWWWQGWSGRRVSSCEQEKPEALSRPTLLQDYSPRDEDEDDDCCVGDERLFCVLLQPMMRITLS